MASHGYPPAFLLPHDQHGVISLWKDHQLMFPIPGLKQGILRVPTPNLRTSPLDKQWKPISGSPESSQFMKIVPTFTTPVLADPEGSLLLSFGISERCARHEKVTKFLMSGTSRSEKGGLHLSLMSELVEFQMAITDLYRHQTATKSPRFDTHVEMEPPFVHQAIYGQEGLLKFIDDFPIHQAILINPDGKMSFVDSAKETMDLLSVLAEFYLPKGSARWRRQRMLVPQFKWSGTVGTPAFINEASLTLETSKVATRMSPKKGKPESAQRRKAKKRAPRERSLYQNNYYGACESFLRLMMDKNNDGRAAIRSFKRAGPQLHKLLTEFSSTIAGAGATVLLSVMCNLAFGRVQFDASNFLATSVGFGLFWLSWAVYKLRDTILYIKKSPTEQVSEEVEGMVRKLDKSVNDIYRAAAFTAVAVLSLP